MTFIKEFPNYYFDNKILYSKHGRKIKLPILNYTKGYWMNKKFVTLNKMKQLTFYKNTYCPF